MSSLGGAEIRGQGGRRVAPKPIFGSKKPSPWDKGGFLELVRRLGTDDVCRLEALGALEQIKLHGLTFI